ncbi:hypothetical protein [Yinghuangia seranimata]|uniref:hypothetical protein n=1 Tax=Yinghuangia seranimata TaxID=408067 RepID=UPI00248BC008|nr:hypothetical protein [Yinghuangia seranimata]MDI2130963.1 hypothetical protein [Yinghuangia seranimata]
MASALRTVMAASIGAAVALGIGAPAATASPLKPSPTRLDPALDAALPAVAGPVQHAALNPLAGTGFNPVDNAVATEVGDLPLSTAMLTGQFAHGTDLETLLATTGGLPVPSLG